MKFRGRRVGGNRWTLYNQAVRGVTIVVLLAGFLRPAAAHADLVTPHQQPVRTGEDEFLQPYLDDLKKKTPAAELERIRDMPKDALSLVHHGYGLWMRNWWLPAKRNRRLIRFLEAKGDKYSDDKSHRMIEALWRDLDRGLSPQERIAAEEKRNLMARRLDLYRVLSQQCSDQIVSHKADLERCFSPSATPPSPAAPLEPYFSFVVSQTGKIGEVTRGPPSARDCVKAVVDTFWFSPFDTDTTLHLWISVFPRCRVGEFNRLIE